MSLLPSLKSKTSLPLRGARALVATLRADALARGAALRADALARGATFFERPLGARFFVAVFLEAISRSPIFRGRGVLEA